MSREDTRPGVNGYLDREGRRIVLAPTLDPAARGQDPHPRDWATTTTHGWPSSRRATPPTGASARSSRSRWRSSSGDALGLDTSAYSVGYVASWADGDATKVLDLAGRINAAADAILSRIEAIGEVVPDAA